MPATRLNTILERSVDTGKCIQPLRILINIMYLSGTMYLGKHLKRMLKSTFVKLAGEPFAVKMNGTLDRLEIIHIDSGEVISELRLNEDYRTVFKQLVELFT